MQVALNKQGAEVGTVLQLHVAMGCTDPYGSPPCCAFGIYRAVIRITFFVPAGGSADQAEAVDFEEEQY